MTNQSKQLVNMIVSKKKVEAAEMFNHLMASRAMDRLTEMKKDIAKAMFKERE